MPTGRRMKISEKCIRAAGPRPPCDTVAPAAVAGDGAGLSSTPSWFPPLAHPGLLPSVRASEGLRGSAQLVVIAHLRSMFFRNLS